MNSVSQVTISLFFSNFDGKGIIIHFIEIIREGIFLPLCLRISNILLSKL